MARPGITYEEVVAVAQDLEKLGEKPSVNRIREVLGNRGSPATISRFIKEWKGPGETGQTSSPPTFDLTSETMQPHPLNGSNEDEGNRPASSHSGPSTQSMQASGNAINPQEVPSAHDLVQDESSLPAQEPAKTMPQAKASAPFDELKESEQAERLEDLDDNALIIRIRRLETQLAKEQSRREAAEKMAEEAKEYADIIKEQIGQRVADLKQSMEATTNQLKAEAREMKQNADSDLKFYREQLQKANIKITSLLTGQAPEPAVSASPAPANNNPSESGSE